jgi:hypothetical protein
VISGSTSTFTTNTIITQGLLTLTPKTNTPLASLTATGSLMMSGSSGANLNLYVYTGGNTAAGNGWAKITIS